MNRVDSKRRSLRRQLRRGSRAAPASFCRDDDFGALLRAAARALPESEDAQQVSIRDGAADDSAPFEIKGPHLPLRLCECLGAEGLGDVTLRDFFLALQRVHHLRQNGIRQTTNPQEFTRSRSLFAERAAPFSRAASRATNTWTPRGLPLRPYEVEKESLCAG